MMVYQETTLIPTPNRRPAADPRAQIVKRAICRHHLLRQATETGTLEVPLEWGAAQDARMERFFRAHPRTLARHLVFGIEAWFAGEAELADPPAVILDKLFTFLADLRPEFLN